VDQNVGTSVSKKINNVTVHDSKIRKRLNNYGLFGGVPKIKAFVK